MTKRDIIKFLERKQQEKLDAIRKDYEQSQEKYEQATYAKLDVPALADKIQPLLEQAYGLWKDWRETCENQEGLTIRGYHTLISSLAYCASSNDGTYKKLVNEHIMLDTKEMEHMYKAYQDEREGVLKTFRTVLASVQQMKTAKQAAAYLKELGFDLSELENPAKQMETALMVPVDTQFLFVKAA
jgi:hypothetical protein